MNLFKFFFPHKHAELSDVRYDLHMTRIMNNTLLNKNENLNAKVANLTDEKVHLERRVNGLSEQAEGLILLTEKHLKEIAQHEQALNKAHEENHMLQTERSHLEARVADLEGEKEYLTQQIEELEGQLDNAQEAYEVEYNNARELGQENEYLRDEKLDLQGDLDDAIEEKHVLLQEIADLRSDITDWR